MCEIYTYCITHTLTCTHMHKHKNTCTCIYMYTHADSTCPVCISSISIPECTAATCPSFPGTDDVMSPQLIPSPSPQGTSSPSSQATSSPSLQAASSPSSQATSSPSSPGTDSTTAPPTCSCSIEAIVITGVVAGVSGIAITLTVVVIVAVIRRQRTSYKLKDLNIRYFYSSDMVLFHYLSSTWF